MLPLIMIAGRLSRLMVASSENEGFGIVHDCNGSGELRRKSSGRQDGQWEKVTEPTLENSSEIVTSNGNSQRTVERTQEASDKTNSMKQNDPEFFGGIDHLAGDVG
jgi:hypothetical protein